MLNTASFYWSYAFWLFSRANMKNLTKIPQYRYFLLLKVLEEESTQN